MCSRELLGNTPPKGYCAPQTLLKAWIRSVVQWWNACLAGLKPWAQCQQDKSLLLLSTAHTQCSCRQTDKTYREKHLDIMDLFIILIVVMITHRCTYVPAHQIIGTNYLQFLICHLYFDKTRKNILISINSHY